MSETSNVPGYFADPINKAKPYLFRLEYVKNTDLPFYILAYGTNHEDAGNKVKERWPDFLIMVMTIE